MPHNHFHTKEPWLDALNAKSLLMTTYGLSNRPTVKIVALRRRRFKDDAPESIDITTHSDSVRKFHCQWVVSGHWRNQPYGPGRTLRKLTYVNPYVKGPDEMPLREARPKVFAVMR